MDTGDTPGGGGGRWPGGRRGGGMDGRSGKPRAVRGHQKLGQTGKGPPWSLQTVRPRRRLDFGLVASRSLRD